MLNANIGRRDLLHILAAGASAAVAGGRPHAAAATHRTDADKKQRAQYQANSSEVQTFYRVNRYPPK
jgi:hypothetical protein